MRILCNKNSRYLWAFGPEFLSLCFVAMMGCFLAISDECAAAPPEPGNAKGIEFYEKKIRPLFAQHCYECHATDSDSIKGGLVLDTLDGWMTGGDSGEAVDLESPADSLLLESVNYDNEDLQMPPKGKLSEAEIGVLKQWVKLGALGPQENSRPRPSQSRIDIAQGRKFWSFQAPKAVAPPKVKGTDWPRSDIDRFVLARLETQGFTPAVPADRESLIRRVTFDLIGLPPTPEEIDLFVAGTSPAAFEKVVDRLLASPQFGERWGRHWLDIARYAESTGKSRNYPYSYAWKYRDYVIHSFNADKPFDQFIREQIAGDLMPASSAAERDSLRVATGFLALGAKELNEGNPRKYQMENVDEQIDTLSRSILGLTVSCARCHDHKFDPIPTSDYYALAGILKSTRILDGLKGKQGNASRFRVDNLVQLSGYQAPADAKGGPTQAARKKLQQKHQAAQQELRRLKKLNRQAGNNPNKKKKNKKKGKKQAGRKKRQDAPDPNNKVADKQDKTTPSAIELSARLAKAQQKVQRLNKQLKKFNRKNATLPPASPYLAMGVRDTANVSDCRIHIRGETNTLGDSVPRGFIQVVGQSTPSSTLPSASSGRLELAHWLTDRNNPLTARVAVNRVWHHLFGRGLVLTVDNFGSTGERPSHPELLDYLAVRFMDGGYSLKKIIREIALSSVYRQGSQFNAGYYTKDPQNIYLWRASHRRLEAESIRDAMLFAAGHLDARPADRSVVMKLKVVEIGRGKKKSPIDYSATRMQRSVYQPVLRGLVPDAFKVFDFAEPSMVKGRRDVTTVATQALFMMNSPFVLDESRAFAERLLADNDSTDEERMIIAYRIALGREPSSDEIMAVYFFLQESYVSLRKEVPSSSGRRLIGWSAFCQSLFSSAEFRYVR